MQKISQKNTDARFIFLTNDRFYVTETIGAYQKVIICAESESVDFAIMSLCAGGVLSASTYSWWGGLLSFTGNCQKDDIKIFLSPKDWGGIRKKEWWPPGFVSHWLEYVPVELDQSLSMEHVTHDGS